MNLIEASVHNPVKTAVGVLIVTLFGTIALTHMPMQFAPEVQTPTITVRTSWSDASPQEVEKELVDPQEEQLKSVEGLTRITSQSRNSLGTVTLEFRVGTRMDEAILRVNSQLQQVRAYPTGAEQPVISTSNSLDRPIAWFLLSKTESGDPELDVTTLLRFAEEEIGARLERVPGVSQINVVGGRARELQVIVDARKLAARQITSGDVRDVLADRNINISSGELWEGKRRWAVRTLGRFESVEQVENQLLAVRDGSPVYVRDVAEVKLGFQRPTSLMRRFGEPVIGINCLRETGANVLEVMQRLQQAIGELNRDVLPDRGLKLTQIYDETDYIDSALQLVRQSIFIGGALTVCVLMLFLHFSTRILVTIPLVLGSAFMAAYASPWFFVSCLGILLISGFWFSRGAIVVASAIPTSIIGTILILRMLDRSLNVISLAGLAFAVGMIVDNAVVVLENIYRRHALGDSPVVAAIRGTADVWGAVVASTLTTLAVFLPVVFVQEEAGQLFGDIALAISAAVVLSLLVSISMIPTAAAKLLNNQRDDSEYTQAKQGAPPGSVVWIMRAANAFVAVVERANNWIQQGLTRRLIVLLLLIGSSIAMSVFLWPKVDYLPKGNRKLTMARLAPPPGYNFDHVVELGESIEAGLRPYWESNPPLIEEFYMGGGVTNMYMGMRAPDPVGAEKLVTVAREIGSRIPGVNIASRRAVLFPQAQGNSINVNISGPDLPRLLTLGQQVVDSVERAIPEAQARPMPSLELSTPQLQIRPKLLQTAESQVGTAELGFTTSVMVDGAYVGDYYLDNKRIDLVVRGSTQLAANTQDVNSFPVLTPAGNLIPLEALADVTFGSGPEQIHHYETERAVTIAISPPPRVPLEQAIAQVDAEIVQPLQRSGELAGGYRATLSGTAGKLRKTWTALRFNVVLALLITYLLMAALFESFLYPLVILFSVPLGAVGGLLGLTALNLFVYQPLDVLTMLGFVILIGTVVNNPILIVHQTLIHIRDEEMPANQAIQQSVRSRIRPIFMTTITTTFGLLPLVVFPGAGSELYRGLGSVVLGGLLVSTIFTLFLVPFLLSLLVAAKVSLTDSLQISSEGLR